jgi:hypothetical protein
MALSSRAAVQLLRGDADAACATARRALDMLRARLGVSNEY